MGLFSGAFEPGRHPARANHQAGARVLRRIDRAHKKTALRTEGGFLLFSKDDGLLGGRLARLPQRVAVV
jgi:hypothetical protein